jgi:hypothetical protein
MMPEWGRKALAKDIAEAQTEEKAKGCSSCLKTMGIMAPPLVGLTILLMVLIRIRSKAGQ